MRYAALAVTVVMALSTAVSTASAQHLTCAAEPVSAKGEPARFEWMARNKARGNWRSKVRIIAGLGGAYANWSNATDTDEYCIKGPTGAVCTFTGRPCRKP